MKRITKYLLAALIGTISFGIVACTPKEEGPGPQFLKGSLERVKYTNTIALDAYIKYVTDSEYKIEIKGPNGYLVDVTKKKAWTPNEPGEYTIVYTVYDGEYEGVSEFPLTIFVPNIMWEYTICNDFYNVGDVIVFEEFFDKMNIAVESYYPWKMVMDNVTVNGVTTEFTPDQTSYTIVSFGEHTFAYHVETEDGQTRHVTQDVGVRYIDEETKAFMEANNMVEYNAITVAEGGVTLNAGEYGGGKTSGAPRWSQQQEQAYLAYMGDYSFGDFVAFDFTGNNMPAIGFFENEPENTMYTTDLKYDEQYKGIVVANGFTQNDGAVFSKWTGSVCNRLDIYGPQKISNPDSDTEGWFRDGGIKGKMVGMTEQANNPDTKFSMVMGFVDGSSTHLTLGFYLSDRDTGEVYFSGTYTFNFAENSFIMPMDSEYYKGNIVAYGHYGKRLVLDKIYPVIHADSLDEAVNAIFTTSKFKNTAQAKVLRNQTLNVADYIVTEPGYTYSLKLADDKGNVTDVTGDTFTLSELGQYTLIYKDGKNSVAALNLTACKKYEISTIEEFLALPTEDPYIYGQLQNDLDFTGIVLNKTEGYNTIGLVDGVAKTFSGVLDGNGYAIKNLTIAPNASTGNAACVIYAASGTIMNLSVKFNLIDLTVGSARNGGFLAALYAGGHVNNCYFDLTTTHYADNNRPVAPLASMVSMSSGSAIIENCVGVLREVANARDGGYAAALVGRINTPGVGKLIMKNCYAVEINPKDGGTAQYYVDTRDDWFTPVVDENNSAYTTLVDMFGDAKTGMTVANGWNSYWSVDATNGLLKFNNTVIYNAKSPKLDVTSASLFFATGTNTNNFAGTVQLNMLNTKNTATFESSDTSVATVDANGLVTAKKGGTAIITATVDGVESTCTIKVYNYYEIASVEEFKTKLMAATDVTLTENDYYALVANLDFTGITLNKTEGYKTIAGGTTFYGILDGNGHSISNLTVTNYNSSGYACLFYLMGGTIKNLAVEMTLDVSGQYYTRNGGLNGQLRPGAYISNCYVEITTPYDTDNNWPVSPYGSCNVNGGTITLENCVGVMNDIANKDAADGYATGLVGRYHGNVQLVLKNCYAIEINPSWNYGDVEAEYYADQVGTGDWQNVTNVTNTYAYDTLAKLFAAAKTGMTAENGWNSFWSVDAANNTLKFGDLVIYQG